MAEIATAAPAQSTWGKNVIRRLIPLVGVVAFLLIWELAVRIFQVKAYLLPPPTAIFQVFVKEIYASAVPQLGHRL